MFDDGECINCQEKTEVAISSSGRPLCRNCGPGLFRLRDQRRSEELRELYQAKALPGANVKPQATPHKSKTDWLVIVSGVLAALASQQYLTYSGRSIESTVMDYAICAIITFAFIFGVLWIGRLLIRRIIFHLSQ